VRIVVAVMQLCRNIDLRSVNNASIAKSRIISRQFVMRSVKENIQVLNAVVSSQIKLMKFILRYQIRKTMTISFFINAVTDSLNSSHKHEI